MKAAEVHGARAEFCCRSGAVEAMKAAEVHGARAEFCCRSGAVGAMKAAEVHGARAGFCCRSGAGDTAAAEASCASWSRPAAIPEQEGKSGAILFSYKFIRTLLALASKVAVGELVAIEVLMYTTERSIKDGEREARQASNMDFIGGEARAALT